MEDCPEEMPSYFKYLRSQYVADFLKRGRLRIGTLSDFRRVEAHGPAIGDREEGMVNRFTEETRDGTTVQAGDDHQLAKALKERFRIPPGVTLKFDKGVIFNFRHTISDCYVYCVTDVFSEESMKAFGCDACIEIQAPDAFFKRISRRLRKRADYIDCRKVIYDKRNYAYSELFPPPLFLKDKIYAYQKEIRAVWRAYEQPIKPFLLEVPEIVSLCRVVVSP